MLNRIKLIISYDGTNYYGFQAQLNYPSIEEILKKAISKILKEDIKIYGSGRTDRGVHAFGQVVHFDTLRNIPPLSLLKGINTYLPKDIRVLDVSYVDSEFHSRFSALKKEYHYRIMTEQFDLFKRNYALFCPNLDIDKMIIASKLLIGTHDFSGFCSCSKEELKSFIRTIYDIKVEVGPNLALFKFTGNAFLKYQVRRMMGALIEIGLNKKPVDFISTVLEKKDPSISHMVADACGLYLVSVTYE